MALWKVTPNWKKSIVEHQYWIKGDKVIRYEEGWRWGTFFLRTEGDEEPVITDDTNIMCADDFELEDWSTDDGCWCDYDFSNMTEEEIEEIQDFFDDGNCVYDLEPEWNCDETEMFITCEVTIEKVEE